MNDDILIVTRHVGAVEWLRKRGYNGNVIPYASPKDVNNRIVVGNPPLHISYAARRVGFIEIPRLPRSLRGQELTCAQLEQYGARIRWYTVIRDEPNS